MKDNPNRFGKSTTRLNFALLGNSGVGKTCIIQQYCKNEYRDTTNTTCCIDFAKKQFEDFILCVFDTAGSERYRALATSYLKNQHGIIIVYDVKDSNSKRDVQKWKSTAESVSPNIPIILVGNKTDLISQQEIDDLIQEEKQKSVYSNVKTFFTSARLKEGIEEPFNYLLDQTKHLIDQTIIQTQNSVSHISQYSRGQYDINKKSCAC